MPIFKIPVFILLFLILFSNSQGKSFPKEILLTANENGESSDSEKVPQDSVTDNKKDTKSPLTTEQNSATTDNKEVKTSETEENQSKKDNSNNTETLQPIQTSDFKITNSFNEKQYNQNFKDGLREVFNSENSKKIHTLGKIVLNHPIPRVRIAAIYALGRLQTGQKWMMLAIDQDGEIVRQAAYEALGQIGPKSAIRYFIRGIKSDDIKIQSSSYIGIGRTQDPAGRQLIIEEGIKSPKTEIVAASIKGLGFYNKIQDLDLISSFLSSPIKELYNSSLDALSSHKTVQSLHILEQEFYDKPQNYNLIIPAIAAKKNIQSTMVMLKIILKNNSPEIKSMVTTILSEQKRFGKFAYISSPHAELRKFPNVRSKLIKSLEEFNVGIFKKSSRLRYIVKKDNEYKEDFYYYIEFPYFSKEDKMFHGWVFGSDIITLTIAKPVITKKNLP